MYTDEQDRKRRFKENMRAVNVVDMSTGMSIFSEFIVTRYGSFEYNKEDQN